MINWSTLVSHSLSYKSFSFEKLLVVMYHAFFLASQTGNFKRLPSLSLICLEIEGADNSSRKG